VTDAGRSRWKALERAIAASLGGERVPVTGRVRGWAPDVRHSWLAIEVKSRKSRMVLIAEMLDQAVKAADWYRRRGEGERLPIGIYHVTGTRVENSVVFMRLKDFKAYFGDSLPKAEEETA